MRGFGRFTGNIPSPIIHIPGSEPRKVGWYELLFDLAFTAVVNRSSTLLETLGQERVQLYSWSPDTSAIATFSLLMYLSFSVWTRELHYLARFASAKADIVTRVVSLLVLIGLTYMSSAGGAGTLNTPKFRMIAASYGACVFCVFIRHIRSLVFKPTQLHNLRSFRVLLIGEFVDFCGAMVAAFHPSLSLNSIFLILLFCSMTGTTLSLALLFNQSLHETLDHDYVSERFGTLIIIFLGEIIQACGKYTIDGLWDSLDVLEAVLSTCCIWWIYFDKRHENMASAVVSKRQKYILFIVVHGLFSVGIAILASATIVMLDEHSYDVLPSEFQFLFTFGAGLTFFFQNMIGFFLRWNSANIREHPHHFVLSVLSNSLGPAFVVLMPVFKHDWSSFNMLTMFLVVNLLRLVNYEYTRHPNLPLHSLLNGWFHMTTLDTNTLMYTPFLVDEFPSHASCNQEKTSPYHPQSWAADE